MSQTRESQTTEQSILHAKLELEQAKDTLEQQIETTKEQFNDAEQTLKNTQKLLTEFRQIIELKECVLSKVQTALDSLKNL